MRGLVSVAVLAVAALGAVSAADAQAPVASHASYTVEPFSPTAPVTLTAKGVRLRAEPFASKDTPVLSSGSTGLSLTVVGIARMSGWNWYQVVLGNGQKAFVRSDLTSAPSQGGAASVTAQPISHPSPQPVTQPAPTFSSTPAPSPLPAPTTITQYPSSPSSTPVSTPAYPSSSAYPSSPSTQTDTAISLVPKSPVPPPLADTPRAGDPSGLQSLPPSNN